MKFNNNLTKRNESLKPSFKEITVSSLETRHVKSREIWWIALHTLILNIGYNSIYRKPQTMNETKLI